MLRGKVVSIFCLDLYGGADPIGCSYFQALLFYQPKLVAGDTHFS
jgi:hypothetical protein